MLQKHAYQTLSQVAKSTVRSDSSFVPLIIFFTITKAAFKGKSCGIVQDHSGHMQGSDTTLYRSIIIGRSHESYLVTTVASNNMCKLCNTCNSEVGPEDASYYNCRPIQASQV